MQEHPEGNAFRVLFALWKAAMGQGEIGGRAKASPERGGVTPQGVTERFLWYRIYESALQNGSLLNLSVGSADSSPCRGAFRKARAAMGAVQTRGRSLAAG